MYNRIVHDILGDKIGLLFCVLGFISAVVIKRTRLFFIYLLAILVFFIIVAEGNIDAPYRQLTIIPSLSVFVAIGILSVPIFISLVIKYFQNSITIKKYYYHVFITFVIILGGVWFVGNRNNLLQNNKNKPVHGDSWLLAEKIKKSTKPDSRIVMAGEYSIHVGGNDLSPVIYYYSDTKGWTLNNKQWNLDYIDQLRKKGAKLFAAYRMNREPNSDLFIKQMENRFHIIYENDKKALLLLDLREPLSGNKFSAAK